MSQLGQESHFKNVKMMENLFKESDLIEKQQKEWERKKDKTLNGYGITRSQKRKLDREGRKLIKRFIAVERKLELLLIKNKKEYGKEVKGVG